MKVMYNHLLEGLKVYAIVGYLPLASFWYIAFLQYYGFNVRMLEENFANAQ